jgi:hypothetical protein
MVLHLTVLEQQAEAPEIFMPAITEWTADMGQQTITHLETGCRFHAFPVQREGIVVPFAAKQIAVRFVGMQDRRPSPSLDEIMRLGTQGILWILTYTMESPRPLRT